MFLYGQPAKYGWKDDVAVAHWKYAGIDGEYSEHTPTVMYYPNTTTKVNSLLQDGSAVYLVKPGFSYLAEFTYENTGFNNQPNTKVAWFISTNKAISTFDRMIGSTQINLPAGAVWTTTVQLTIPADLKLGMTYYLGVIVDYQNNIGEFNDANNSSFLQITIIAPI